MWLAFFFSSDAGLSFHDNARFSDADPSLFTTTQQEAVPVLIVHAILKGGRFVEAGTDLPKEETPDWLKPSGRRNEGMERLEKLDGHNQGGQGFKTETTRTAPLNPLSYILSTSLIEVGAW